MKIYVDDVRPAPDASWTLCKTFWDFKKLLKAHIDEVTVISFDHDLGDERAFGNGYKCMEFLEVMLHQDSFTKIPEIRIHTANPAARVKMELAKKAIESLANHWRK